MIAQDLAAIALSMVAPVLMALVVRLWGVPGKRKMLPAFLLAPMALVAVGCGWCFFQLQHTGSNFLLYGICAMALICTAVVCTKLLRHRLRAHWLLAHDHWSCDEVVELVQLAVRFYRKPRAEFKLRVWLVANPDPHKPAELRVHIGGDEKWRRTLEVGWSHEIIDQVGRAFDYPGEGTLIHERCIDLMWQRGAQNPGFVFHKSNVPAAA